ncbi:lysylphosphatidylglycerol synthase domain-containing protein [Marixanthomonas ophiurae]|uniref:Uncharacterized protein n=1 Tax=Marixanthomonas ophiurae TaxID=387659 RepID=A0A3E1QBF9_9FLAO|nr:lysylphosphatidylglycerol synthase domain-containing protein [Marixanthomonas ophiurae]RFN59479.1 hypothetical protein DZ858_05305 [Marixanthomonas ophiurae]
MRTVLHKSKQYWLVALKVLLLGLTFAYIYYKITSGETLKWNLFTSEIQSKSFAYILLFILLAAINWFFEIAKWQTTVSKIKFISFFEATKQSLMALTISLPTPNRIGDYGAKAFFYPSEKRKEILLLNFLSNSIQMIITCFFGGIGLCILALNYSLPVSSVKLSILISVLLIVAVATYFFRKKQLLIKGLSVINLFQYIKKLSYSLKLKLLLYSFIRYFVFSFLFFVILLFFDANISILKAVPLIFAMYLLVSILPSFFVFDVVVRGGVAVWLFSLAGVDELTVLCTVFTMWLLNFILPALIGGFYVARYKTTNL